MCIAKRSTDIVLGAVLALICLPVMLVTALISAATLRSWPFFVQERVGWRGRIFRLIKIRTLPPAAPKYASKYDLSEVEVPAATAWLRRMHFDELPQLLLVPFGRMSLVGPRPEMQLLATEFDDSIARRRTSVRPGCTGLWQVGPRSEGLIPESPQFDDYYIEHQSLRLDLWIMWRTFGLMAFGRPPVALDAIPALIVRRRTPTPTANEVPEPALETSA